jgi:hypothetical protein
MKNKIDLLYLSFDVILNKYTTTVVEEEQEEKKRQTLANNNKT